MDVVRHDLDMTFIVRALLRGDSYSTIADREAQRLGRLVTRNVIAGVSRDLRYGKLSYGPTATQTTKVKTYRFGVEDDNGGVPIYTEHPELEGNAVVISDLHLPKTDYDFLKLVPKVGRRLGITRLIIAGDLVDGGSQGKHHRRKVKPVTTGYEYKIARQVLDELAEWFDEIVYEPGNHEDWLLENMGGDLQIEDVYQFLFTPTLQGKLFLTPYDRITLYSEGEKWTIPHQTDYSKHPLVVGSDLAQKFQSNMIIPHQHITALGKDWYDRYVVVDIGGLHEPTMFDYVQLKTSRNRTMSKGFAAIKDGGVTLYTDDDRITDWRNVI